MAGAAVQIPLSGLSREIEAIGRAIPTDTRPLINQWSVYLGAAAKRRFVNQADPEGVPWAPLKRPRSRPRDKRRNKTTGGKPQGGQKILRDTGLLMASMTGQAQGTVQRMTDTTLEQGTNLFYAAFHQYGTRHMVARPFIGVNEQDADKLTLMAADFFGVGR